MTPTDSGRRAGASALARLVGDDLPGFATAWGERHWLHHGPGYADLLDLAAIDELLTTRGLRTPFLRVAKNGSPLPERSFTSGGGVGAAVTDQIDDARLARLFADGSTIVLQGLHRTWQPIAAFVADLSEGTGHPAQANVYVTPPQSQGFSAHYDVHDVFVLQLAGRKRWVIHEPVLQWPTREETWETGGRRTLVAEAAESEPALDVVLEPGDCLYLPRGYLHAATALGGVSAHLTIGLHVWTRRHLASELMSRALATASDLGRPLPLGVDVGSPADLAEDADAVRTALIAAISELTDDELAAALDRRADDTARPAPVAPLAQAAAVRDLTAGTSVRLRPHLRLRRTVEEGAIRLRGRGIDLRLDETPGLAPALDVLLDGDAHRAVDVAVEAGDGAGDEAAATDLVRSLMTAGILVPVP